MSVACDNSSTSDVSHLMPSWATPRAEFMPIKSILVPLVNVSSQITTESTVNLMSVLSAVNAARKQKSSINLPVRVKIGASDEDITDWSTEIMEAIVAQAKDAYDEDRSEDAQLEKYDA